MSAECAVCYVSDINYLLPSLVSAMGVRKFVPAHKADIYIYLIDQEERVGELNRFLKPYDIRILPMDSRVYSGFDMEKFHKAGISTATLGRLFIDSMLPESCQRIIYIDGDTWIGRDPSALIETVVPEGKFAAVNDILCIYRHDPMIKGRNFRAYIKALGLKRNVDYFNAGVFATSRNTWKALAPEAYKFFLDNIAICKFHDQSALNAVMGDRRLRLSLKWNFQILFRYFDLETRIDPCIYHFIGQVKPWMGEGGPWNDVCPDYRNALTPFDELNLPIKTLAPAALQFHSRVYWKKALIQKSPFLAKLASMLFGIGAYEKKAWL